MGTKALYLFDTYERERRLFEPLDGNTVRMYACGPTVYNYVHIGNLRTYLFEDLLRRVLEFNGYEVHHVVNITDVGHLTSDADSGDDKMEVGAKRMGMTAWDLAELYTEAFKADLEQLNIRAPRVWCKATDHIPEQIAFIENLEAKGYIYRTQDGIYFDSQKLDRYGYLARLDVDGLRQGARVDPGERRFVTDFALWKFSKPEDKRQMEWESPWGRGFPGWHIECSAMSAKYLGDFFDIHCGGEDHIPIHHTNEIAQTEASLGTRLANFWMHGYFLQLGSEKMSKSSGDFLRLALLETRGISVLAYRYFCMTAHYRTQMNFSWESLEASQTALNRLYEAAYSWGAPGEVIDSVVDDFHTEVNDDLNFPKALAVVWGLVKADFPAADKKATLLKLDELLGLDIAEWKPATIEIPEAVMSRVLAREDARKQKDFTKADALRDEVLAAGFVIEDTRDGPKVNPS